MFGVPRENRDKEQRSGRCLSGREDNECSTRVLRAEKELKRALLRNEGLLTILNE